MKLNSRSIYGCTMAEPGLVAPPDCRLTQSEDGKRLYLHLFAYPFLHVQLRGLAGKVDYAEFLHDGSELRFTEEKPTTLATRCPRATTCWYCTCRPSSRTASYRLWHPSRSDASPCGGGAPLPRHCHPLHSFPLKSFGFPGAGICIFSNQLFRNGFEV